MIAADAPIRAFSFVQGLVEAAEGTSQFPEAYAVAFRGRREYRRVVRGAYRIFYSIEPDHIRIARIIHGARLLHAEMLP